MAAVRWTARNKTGCANECRRCRAAISRRQETTRGLFLIGKTDEIPIRENIAVKLQAMVMDETAMMATAAALSQMVNEARTMGKIIDGRCRAHHAEMTITASQVPAGTMPETIAIRISGIMSKIPAVRILEAKIPDPTRASGQTTTGTTEIRSAMAAPIAMEQGRMPPATTVIRIHPPMAAVPVRETRSSRLKDRKDSRITATTLRNSPPMRTMEIAETQADGVSFHIRPNRMEMTTKVLASSRLKDRRIMATTLRNSPAMRTTEIAETQADHISLHIPRNRMEMTTKVLVSSRLKGRRDSRTMATTLRNSQPMRTTEIVEIQGDRIKFPVHLNRMEIAIKGPLSSRQEVRQDQPIVEVALRIPRRR
jgi:hypothetical protein